MPVKRTIPFNCGMFFITFTCYNWLTLIEKVNGYDIVYKWFDHLKGEGHFINGYVIMPNHVHALISFINTKQTINAKVGNGKRFMAYDIIKRLIENSENELLEILALAVAPTKKKNKKLHEVWIESFDWKDCRSHAFVYQKLDYMHNNPFTKKWVLCNNPLEYPHSSAKFYLTGEQGFYSVTNFMEMEDVSFNSTKK